MELTEIKEVENKEELSKSELRKTILAFTWPCMGELVLISLISIVNMSMVGHLGAYAISAVGLTTQPTFISIAVFQSFNVGATALVARFIGAKEYDKAKNVVIQALLFAIFSGILLSIAAFVFSRQIVIFMGAQQDTLAYANLYMKYMAAGMFFQSVPTAVTSVLRGAGDSKSPMRFNIIANIVNILVGLTLIYGFWKLPALGIHGAAIAATLAKLASCLLSIYAIFNSKLPIVITVKDRFRLDTVMLKRIVNIGFAAAGEQFAMRVGFIIYSKIVADLGTISFAAHQICISVVAVSFNIGQAFGLAATSFMGRYLGSKKPEIAQAYCKELRRLAMIASIILSAGFFFGGYGIARIFTTDIDVIVTSAFLMKLIVLMTPAQNSQLVIAGGLRGAGDTKWPMFAAIGGVILVRVPLVIILIKGLHYGVGAAWVAAVIDQYVRSAIVYIRFVRGKWKALQV